MPEVLKDQPGIRWVQLPFAGVENAFAAGIIDPSRTWTCAKGLYAEPVAEHALTLALAGLRLLPERIRAQRWGTPAGTSLYGAPVTILGGGGITEELLTHLAPFRVRATVVRRQAESGAGGGPDRDDRPARRGPARRPGGVPGARADARHGAHRRPPPSWRPWASRAGWSMWPGVRHVHTDALVDALRNGAIAGAALDVTDPEPLPDGHPLWDAPNCIITPHTADTWEMIMPLLAARIRANVAHFAAGEPLEGVVDPAAGY